MTNKDSNHTQDASVNKKSAAEDKSAAANKSAAGNKSHLESGVVEDAIIIQDEKKLATSESSANKKGAALAAVAFILALLAVAATAYVAWISFQQAEQLQSLSADSKQYYQQTQKLQQSLRRSQNETELALTQQNQQREELLSAIDDANLIIDSQGRRLRSLTSTTTDDWRLAEVEYLLRLANQRILISKDSTTALNLLATADQILLTLADPRFFDIRKAIAEDRAALLLVGQQDLDGVFLRLSALTQQLDKLPLIVMPTFDTTAKVEIDNVDDSVLSSWQQSINAIGSATWQELKGLVVINQRDSDIKPLLPPDQQYYLRGNLQLMINQSQLALLDGRQAVYSDSLYRAERWLQDYFASDTDAIQSVIADIQQLQTIKVNVELPDIANALLAVKQFFSEQRQIEKLKTKPDTELDTHIEDIKIDSELPSINKEAAL
ncbi:uroporphyrinogen-III C-methyltransferase [Pseudomonadales bacterium]|nr:uroporphyrinogen-III C-methyltransferase [Pseudomonadales bacterium]